MTDKANIIETMARALCEAQGVRRIDGNEMARARDEAQAAITAITEAGYAIVPVEPTMEMSDAGFCTLDGQADCSCSAGRVWDAMITTAQGDG